MAQNNQAFGSNGALTPGMSTLRKGVSGINAPLSSAVTKQVTSGQFKNVGGKSTAHASSPQAPVQPPAQTEQQLHDAKVNAITDQITSLQKQQKDQKAQDETNMATYPQGVPPQKDVNGVTTPYVAPTQNQQAVSGLLNIENGKNDAVNNASQDIANIEKQAGSNLQAFGSEPGTLTGTIAASQGKSQNDLIAAEQKLGNVLQGQGQQITAGTAGANATQPVGQFGMLTNPQTGKPLNPEFVTNALGVVNQALANNTPITDPYLQSIITTLGLPGITSVLQLQNALHGGTFNPSVQSATSTQNINQGVATGGTAYQLDTALKQVDTLQPLVNSILQGTGINQTDYPKINSLSRQTVANLNNPGLTSQWDSLMTEYQNIASQIINSGGVSTPSGVQAAAQLLSPKDLSLGEIQSLMQTVKDAGNARLSVLQTQSNTSLGGGNNLYTGTPTTAPKTTTPAQPTGANFKPLQNPYTQSSLAIMGNIATDAFNYITNPNGLLSIATGFLLGNK